MKRRTICHVLAAMFSIGVVAPNAFMVADRAPPFELRNGITIPAVLTPGGLYQFQWDIVPRTGRHCDGIVYWSIVDAQGVIWATPPAASLFTEISLNERRVIVGRERTLPSGVSSGPVRLEPSMTFACNWTHYFWPIYVKFPSVVSRVR